MKVYLQQVIFRLGGKRSSNRSVYKIYDCCERCEANNTGNSAAKGIKGFTLIEAIMVILLVAIIGAIVSPTLTQHALFTEKYFADNFISILRYARLIAQTSGCEVQLAYQNQNQIALFWRNDCHTGTFDKKLPSPYLFSSTSEFVMTLPAALSLKTSLPIYFLPKGGIYNDAYQRQSYVKILLPTRQIYIDGLSGFAYVKPI